MHNTGRTLTAVLAAAGIAVLAAGCGSSGSDAGSTATTSTDAGDATPIAATSAEPAGSTGSTGSALTGSAPTGSGPSGPVGGTSAAPGTAASANYPVDLQPPTAAPGSQVMVYGLTCSAATGTATSSAFTAKVPLSMLSDATGGAATVKPGLAAGKYPVTIECGDITVTGTLTVS